MKRKLLLFICALLACIASKAYDFASGDLLYNITDQEKHEVEVTFLEDGEGNVTYVSGDITIPGKIVKDGVVYTVTGIGEGAFANCKNLTSVKLTDNVKRIGAGAFMGCDGLTSFDLMSVEYLGAGVFSWCGSLKSMTIPSTVKIIDGGELFAGCESLEKVVFEEGVTWMWVNAFAWCPNLEEVILPSTLERAYPNWFGGCPKLKKVVMPIRDPVSSHALVFGLADSTCPVTIPNGSAKTYLQKGYYNISDVGELEWIREEFEEEVARIEALMNDKGCISSADAKTALQAAITSARAAAKSAKTYLAIFEQIATIKQAAATFLSKATIKSEVDVTSLVRNPMFNRVDYGWNVLAPGIWSECAVGCTDAKWTNADVTIDRFVQSFFDVSDDWHKPTLEDGEISQVIKNLPAGIYRLEADLIATWQDDASTKVKGVSLFANGNETPVATKNEKPEHFTVRFANPQKGDVTIGVKWKNTNANWVAMDNVRLIIENPAMPMPNGTALKSSETDTLYIYNKDADMFLNAGNNWGTHAVLAPEGLPTRLTQEKDGSWRIYFFEGSHNDQYLYRQDGEDNNQVWVDYYGSGQPDWIITDNEDGTYFIQNKGTAATSYLGNIPSRLDYDWNTGETITTHVEVVSNATAVDNIHWQFITKEQHQALMAKHVLMQLILKAKDAGVDTQSVQLVYADANATFKEVETAIRSLNKAISAVTMEENGTVCVTDLIANPRFGDNTAYGWSGKEGGATRAQTHEFYQTNFNMFQTVHGLQNGVYRLKYKGFSRPGSYGSAYRDYQNGNNNVTAVIYANGVEKKLNHIAIGAQDDGWMVDGKNLPNTMEDAREYFDAGLYSDFIDVVVSDGQLTFGIRDDHNNDAEDWVIFSDFELYYLSNTLAVTADKALISVGKANVSIDMYNDEPIAGLQFMVKLPEGITLQKNEKGNLVVTKSERLEGLTLTAAEKNGGYQVLVYGVGGEAIEGNSGSIVDLNLALSKSIKAGNYSIELTDIVLTKTDGTQMKPQNVQGVLSLLDVQAGDANGDGEINVADIVEVVNYILGRPSDIFMWDAADLNGDGEVNVTDIVAIVNIILTADVSSAKMRGIVEVENTENDMVALFQKSNSVSSLELTNEGKYVASQFDLVLAEGQRLNSITLNEKRANDHSVSYSKVGENTYRVVVYSLSNTAYEGSEGELLNIDVTGDGEYSLENILFVTAQQVEKRFAPLAGEATGINSTVAEKTFDIYSVDGILLYKQATTTEGLPKGVYIIEGKKYLVK
jgi:hypothetical protein